MNFEEEIINIDNLMPSFDFGELKSDCLVHSFLKA